MLDVFMCTAQRWRRAAELHWHVTVVPKSIFCGDSIQEARVETKDRLCVYVA